ncbi:MAG TPA: hypothetical protein VN428_01180 [Bryobacteraceae bacterium]|nr:hypothetical protein [Bryobacteraceae bacterium]
MHYNPRLFLRQVPNALLARFFNRYAEFVGFDWGQLSETRIEPIFAQSHAMPELERRKVVATFRKIHSLATPAGTTVLIEAIRDAGLDVVTQIKSMRNAHERAFWCYLEHPAAFENARTLAHIDGLPSRSSERRTGLPQRALDVTDEMLTALQHAVAAYFLNRDGRGERCAVEYRRRPGEADSFFVYPADYADEIIGYNESGELSRKPWRGVFEVVFTYHAAEGTLDIYSQGGKAVREDLAALFVRIVLGEDRQPTLWEGAPYRLEVFKNRNLTLPTNPRDSMSVSLRGLTVGVPKMPGARIEVRVAGRTSGSAYKVLEEAVDQHKLPLSECTVLEASLQAVFQTAAKKPKSITFRVSPTSCTLGNTEEEEKLKQYLKKWEIAS